MAQASGRAGEIPRRSTGQQQAHTENVVTVVPHLCHLVDRYVAVQRMVLARYPQYGNATGRAAFGARLDQLEALIRETKSEADTAL